MRRSKAVAAASVLACLLSSCVLGATGDPHLVTDDSAVLTGTLQSTSSDQASYWFEYGLTASYGWDTGQSFVDVVNDPPSSVSARIGGLTPGTTYHYRLCWDTVNDSLPAGCHSDRTLTTGVGRVSVSGLWSTTQLGPFTADIFDYRIEAVADAPGPGYVDGTLTVHERYVFVPQNAVIYEQTSTFPVYCLRVAGNRAVVEVGGLLYVIEDNDATGDRFSTTPVASETACPDPSTSQLGPTPTPGDFTIQGGA